MVSAAPQNLRIGTKHNRKQFSATRTDGATWSMDYGNAIDWCPSWYADCFLSSQKFPLILGNPSFITEFTTVHILSYIIIFSRTLSLRHALIFSCHLFFSLPSGLFSSGFPTKILYVFFIVTEYATCVTISFYKCRVKGTYCDTHHYMIFSIHMFQIFTKSILNYPQSMPFPQSERPRCTPFQNMRNQIFLNKW